jgi:hypothetical protein
MSSGCSDQQAGICGRVGSGCGASSVKQFAESPDFDEAVVDAVSDNEGAHN